MNKNIVVSGLEKEARGILQYWVDLANTYLSDSGIADVKSKVDGVLDMLEGMLLIYNVFANMKCEIFFNRECEGYEIKFFEQN